MIVRQITERLLRDADPYRRMAGLVFRELTTLLGEEASARDARQVADILTQEGAQLGAVLVVGQYAWGKGVDEKEAVRNAKRSGGVLHSYSVYAVHPETVVDELGDLVHPAAHVPRLLREVRRRRPASVPDPVPDPVPGDTPDG